MTKQRRGSSGGTILFISALAVGTGAAFATGAHLRDRIPQRNTVVTPHTQYAQASENGKTAFGGMSLPRRTSDDGAVGMSTFETVYQLVEQNYVDKLPEDRKLSQGAVKGMLSTLNDPSSIFLDKEQHDLVVAEGEGRFAGIGAALQIRPINREGYTEYKIIVVAPVAGSPAEKAGLKSGDVITHVDGKWVLGYDPFLKFNKLAKKIQDRENDADEDEARKELEAAKKRAIGGITLHGAQLALRGDVSTVKKLKLDAAKRTVTVERTGVKEPLKLTMETAGITEVQPVSSKTLTGGVGYVRVSLLTPKAVEEFRSALTTVPTDKGLVLDLRGNSGGGLEAARGIAAAFAPGSPLGFEVGAGGKSVSLKAADAEAPAKQVSKVAVLVDNGTARYAEMLAAALADRGIGTLVGGPTFGGASVQKLYTLADGSGFTLTTGKVISPNRVDWQGKGLVPRVKVAANATDEQVLGKALDLLAGRGQFAATPPRVR